MPASVLGTSQPALLAQPVHIALHLPELLQFPKPILLNTGEATLPYAWSPSTVDIQMLKVGNLVMCIIPGELTTMAGRRLRNAVRAALIADGIIDETAYFVVSGCFGSLALFGAGCLQQFSSVSSTTMATMNSSPGPSSESRLRLPSNSSSSSNFSESSWYPADNTGRTQRQEAPGYHSEHDFLTDTSRFSPDPSKSHEDTHPLCERSMNYQQPSYQYSIQHHPEFQALVQANVALSTEVQTLKRVNDSLVAALSNRAGAHIPQLSATVPAALISLEQGPDTKRVKFWQKDKWKLAIKQSKGRSSGKIHRNSLQFIEDKNGEVTFDDKNACRGWCYKFFHGLQEEGRAPDSWGKASLALTSEFCTAVETKYPNLRLCHSHWKADQLAGIVYPSWHSTHGDKEGKVKQEAPDVAFSDDESLSSDDDKIQSAPQPRSTNKRGRSDVGTSGSSVSKRAKTVDAPLKKKVANPLFGKTPKPVHALTTAGGGPNVTSAPLIPPPSQFTTVTTPVMPPVSQSIVVDPIAKTSPSQIASDLLLPVNDVDSVPPSTVSPSHDGASSLLNLPAITPAITPVITAAIASSSTPSHEIVLLPIPVAPVVNLVTTTTTTLAVPPPTPPTPVLPPTTSLAPTLALTNPVPTTRKKKWNPDRNSVTPRGLCTVDYHKKHPQAELVDFDGYWRGLPDTEKQAWKMRSENAKVALKFRVKYDKQTRPAAIKL
ncbi:hypothetical protein K438DRAFT_1769851 [Mycena galopus ATCC 62051]|nr:hypothetical protein K438DRAFT_1769851 [Mycena galopus ATCC 62051]